MNKKFLPIIFALLLATGIYLGSRMCGMVILPSGTIFRSSASEFRKLNEVLKFIEKEYVDTVDEKKIVNASIEKILQQLDPHSSFITAEDFNAANEPLEGNFEGIGIEFHLQLDTIMVVSTISGGPSDMVGLQPGDRIVRVDDKIVAGIGFTNEDVLKTLRGKEGTRVKLSVLRRGSARLLDFTVTRGKIPIYSLDASYMADSLTGYIKLSRFAASTYQEFHDALLKLKAEGMTQLVLDLRGNPGGYLEAATRIADEFLVDGKLIVYTQGKSRPRTEYTATSNGDFEDGNIVILIDEGSASASEIVAGALQDWDRATIVGRRSFGKGLVQEQTVFSDGSALRLTVARYYTPTGRSIQKPYSNGYADYEEELTRRLAHGELLTSDSIRFSDSLKFSTPSGKIVYGGGGIMPDVFVAADTSITNSFLNQVYSTGSISQFAYDYVDNHRSRFSEFKDATEFFNNFNVAAGDYDAFLNFAKQNGVKFTESEKLKSKEVLMIQLKAFIGRQLFRSEIFYRVLNQADPAYTKALDIIRSP